MISIEEFNKAKQIINEYTSHLNKSFITNHICICCKTKEVKPLEGMGLAEGAIKASE